MNKKLFIISILLCCSIGIFTLGMATSCTNAKEKQTQSDYHNDEDWTQNY